MAVLEKALKDETVQEEAGKAEERRNNRRNEKSMKNINNNKDALVPLTEKSLPYWETTKYEN